jgi:hypothetical protein
MSVERVYTVSKVGGRNNNNQVLPVLLLVGILLFVGFTIWYITARKKPQKLAHTNVQKPLIINDALVKQDTSKAIAQPTPKAHEQKLPVLPHGVKDTEKDKIAAGNKPILTNTIVGRVLQQQPNEAAIGALGVSVFYFYNNAKREVFTDSEGNYQIVLPVYTADAVDCKIILYYKKGNVLNTQQTITCNQNSINDITFTVL